MKEKSKGPAILLGASFLKKVDEWRRKQRDHPSRAVAIRRLAQRGLASSITPRRRSKESRRKAAEMADREIEHLGDRPRTTRNALGGNASSSKARENSATYAPIGAKTKVDLHDPASLRKRSHFTLGGSHAH